MVQNEQVLVHGYGVYLAFVGLVFGLDDMMFAYTPKRDLGTTRSL